MGESHIKKLEELLVKAVQSGKQETSGIVMEIKTELKDVKNKIGQIVDILAEYGKEQSVQGHRLGDIDNHLKELNSKTKSNIDNIEELKTHKTVVDPKIEVLMEDLKRRAENDKTRLIEENKALKTYRMKWMERIVWVVVLVIATILVRVGLVAPELISTVFGS